MKFSWNFPGQSIRLGHALFLMTLLSVFPTGVYGSLIFSVQSVTAGPGTSGNGFDVLLSNTGPSAVTVAAFTFGISIANNSISFTDANTSTTAPYIFSGHSLFGPDLTGATSGQSLSTSDVFDTVMSGTTMGVGSTVGIGRVLFSVSPTAGAGVFPVVLASFPLTSLSDPTGNNLAVQTLSPGQITITGVTIPEPSTISTMLLALACILGGAVKRAMRTE